MVRHKVHRMLLAKGKITTDLIALLNKWRHTGFNVYYKPRILPWQKKSMKNNNKNELLAFISGEIDQYSKDPVHTDNRDNFIVPAKRSVPLQLIIRL